MWPSSRWRRTARRPAVTEIGAEHVRCRSRPAADRRRQQRGLAGPSWGLGRQISLVLDVEVHAGEGRKRRAARPRHEGGRRAPWRPREGTFGPSRQCEAKEALRLSEPSRAPTSFPSDPREKFRRHRARMITAGVLILLFVVYQLWGTGIRSARPRTGSSGSSTCSWPRVATPSAAAQRPPATSTTSGPSGSTTTATLLPVTAPTAGLNVAEGDLSARSRSRRSGLPPTSSRVAADDLKEGPGHYPETFAPGRRERGDRRAPHDLRRALRRPRPAGAR